MRRHLLAMPLAAAMLCGCNSYRYSARIVTPAQECLPAGSYRIVGGSCDSKWLTKFYGEEQLKTIDVEGPLEVKVKVRQTGQRRSWGNGFATFINWMSFGLIPFSNTAEFQYTATINPADEVVDEDPYRFDFVLERRIRFSPFGFWPYLFREYPDEILSTAWHCGRTRAVLHLQAVLDEVIKRGIEGDIPR